MFEEKIYRPAEAQPEPCNVLPLTGWGLVLGSIIAYAYLLFPGRWMDVDWEFEMMGSVVDNSLLSLLGMALVFHGRTHRTTFQKLIALRVLLIFGLLLGFFYLLMLPLAYNDENRLIIRQNIELRDTQDSLKTRREKIEEMIKKISTIKDLQSMGAMFNFIPTSGQRAELKLDENVDALKKWTITRIQLSLHEQMKQAFEHNQSNVFRLEKGCLRIMAGSLLASVCYLIFVALNFGLFRDHQQEPVDSTREE